MKLFEYMAADRPILASDLPSIREILDENNATFFKPDDSKDLSEKVKYVLSNPESTEKRTRQAKEDVKNYTWQKRAEKIMEFLDLIKY
jgi:glycosyltransferase involved in cell wall biosynthesis